MLDVAVHVNGDDAFVTWQMSQDDRCWGVALYREIYRNGEVTSSGYLRNQVGFEADAPRPGETRPSTDWPFQRYTWTDHGVGEGDEVAYWVVPVVYEDGWLVADEANAASTPVTTVSSDVGSGRAYFNRGVVLSQFMLRNLPKGWSNKPRTQKLADLRTLTTSLEENSSKLRAFLMGDLGAALHRLLADELAAGSEIHCALYELSDPQLIKGLKRFGQRAHVILANGSTKNSRKPRKPTPYDDGNAEAAAELGASIDLHRRMFFSSQGLGHNKFLVVSRNGAPAAVWTGSTNWATTGLCTQVNNAVLLEDPALARIYLDQWNRLAADVEPVPDRGVDAPLLGPPLLQGNDQVHEATAGSVTSRVWFTRTSNGAELDEVVQLIHGAERAVFFVLFEPGSASTVVAALRARLTNASGVHVHGVINTIRAGDPDTPEGGDQVEVEVVTPEKADKPAFRLDIIQPEGVESDLTSWATEVTRRDFVIGSGGVIGHAIVHTKALVIDPFTNPVVVTGSHNFSARASSLNDENLLIRRGDRALAERYAVEIMGVYQHYRWRSYLHDCAAKGITPWDSLEAGSGWQSKLTDERQRELSVWL
jgi:phosphatidylserine/phosphatidylglycerophosphate/cardiolipin synthase-like enzyme